MNAPETPGLEGHLAQALADAIGTAVSGRRVVVWGASTSGARTRAAIAALGPAALIVVDSSLARQAAGLGSLPVAPPEAIEAFAPDTIVLATTSAQGARDMTTRARALAPTAHVASLLDVMPRSGLAVDVVHLSLERPTDDARVVQRVPLQGWAAAGTGIVAVSIEVDGRPAGRLAFGVSRPDVAATLGRTPGAAAAGFIDTLDVSALADGPHELGVVVHPRRGRPVSLTRRIVKARESSLSPGTCPFCGEADRHLVRWGVNDFSLARCGGCGGSSVTPPPSADACRAWYNDPDVYAMITRAREQAHSSPRHPDALRLAALLRPRVPAGRPRLLEIGCSNGRLLHGLCKQGFDVTGVEVSRETSQVARDVFGLDVRTGWLEEQRFDAPFDAIVARHVIEHLPEPLVEFRRMRTLLAPGGIVLLITPNAASLAARLLRERWEWCIPPLHLHYFTGTAMKRLAERAGFAVVLQRSRRGDAQPLGDELVRWTAPLHAKGAHPRAVAYRLLAPIVRRLDAGHAEFARAMWHEELLAMLEAR